MPWSIEHERRSMYRMQLYSAMLVIPYSSPVFFSAFSYFNVEAFDDDDDELMTMVILIMLILSIITSKIPENIVCE